MKKIANDFDNDQDLVLNCCGFADDEYDDFLGIGKKAKAKKAARKEAKAEKAMAKGKTAKAERLLARAAQIKAKLAAKGFLTGDEEKELQDVEAEIRYEEGGGSYDTRSGEAGSSNKILLYGGLGVGVLAVVVTTVLLLKGKKGKKGE